MIIMYDFTSSLFEGKTGQFGGEELGVEETSVLLKYSI